MKNKSKRNQTLEILAHERDCLLNMITPITGNFIEANSIINSEMEKALSYIKPKSVDLLILDPPYNLNKNFNGKSFKKMDISSYSDWIEDWIKKIIPLMKSTGSIYFCSDWLTSTSVHLVMNKYANVINRITWEREKGRGAKSNWKNSSEDIWFCTMSKDYTFNVEAVKMKRKVIAPYRVDGKPKDWDETKSGNFRLTHPSNLWSDITIPFWSMPENTDHPTQKPEKLLAKLILASSNEGDLVLDPFMGSGTTAVVAKKLRRKYIGIELNEEYCLYAAKRLKENSNIIQGYSDGVFLDRNMK